MGIPARELQGLVEAIPAAHVVHVFDCSHASAGLAARPGRVVLAACGADEVAHESGTGGDFTRRIVNALRGGAPGDGPHVTVFDVFEYAQAAVAR